MGDEVEDDAAEEMGEAVVCERREGVSSSVLASAAKQVDAPSQNSSPLP